MDIINTTCLKLRYSTFDTQREFWVWFALWTAVKLIWAENCAESLHFPRPLVTTLQTVLCCPCVAGFLEVSISRIFVVWIFCRTISFSRVQVLPVFWTLTSDFFSYSGGDASSGYFLKFHFFSTLYLSREINNSPIVTFPAQTLLKCVIPVVCRINQTIRYMDNRQTQL